MAPKFSNRSWIKAVKYFQQILRLKTWLTFCVVFITCDCVPRSIHHKPRNAATVALQFADLAFVKHDFDEASKLAINGSTDAETVAKIRGITVEIHPSGKYPKEIFATFYEPIAGTGRMKIFIDGLGSDNGKYYYLLVLELENPDSYKVSEVYRNPEDNPFPITERRQPL